MKQKQEKKAQRRLSKDPAMIEAVESLDPEDLKRFKRFLNGDVKINKTHTLKRRELVAKAILDTLHLRTSLEGKRESLQLAKQLLKMKDQK